MLQKYSVQEQLPQDDGGSFLTPAFVIDVLKRRLLYFLIPFVLVLGIGTTVVMLIPAVYLAEGKILVESQQIPSDLVRPTVTAVANERIQVISQRILTRDNLLTVAAKYQLFAGRQKQLTGTEMVDQMRSAVRIKPIDLKSSRGPNSVTLAFTVGFEHEQPAVAMRVAGEFVNMILSEDVRVRTAFASETTKFLEREAKRLENELFTVEAKIAEAKRDQARPTADTSDAKLSLLRAELMQKAATYSESHPDMKAIKQKIAALEKMVVSPKDEEKKLEPLERQQSSIMKNLEMTTQKLVTARLGESLERGQQSERLEVIEQPTLPTKPIKPNRPKFLGLVLAMSLAAGGGLVFLLEFMQSTIYRTSDLLRVADSHLVVVLPYVTTEAETQRRKTRTVLLIGSVLFVLIVAVLVSLFFLPPFDLLWDKVLLTLGM
jgi:uncharacterized protein involved in exopolysaccharide biosynthesis